jgi:hypothetical protein
VRRLATLVLLVAGVDPGGHNRAPGRRDDSAVAVTISQRIGRHARDSILGGVLMLAAALILAVSGIGTSTVESPSLFPATTIPFFSVPSANPTAVSPPAVP